MSFQTLPATQIIEEKEFNLLTFQWVSRLIVPLIVGTLMLTSTGCSLVTSIFGSSESAVTGVEARPTRVLMPTPAGERSARSGTNVVRNGPTPTPFVMRPTQAGSSTMAEEDGSPAVDTEDDLVDQIVRITIIGDSVNVRNAPGLDSQIIATVSKDTQFDLLDESPDGDWIQVCCVDTQLVWVYRELTQVQANAARSTIQNAVTTIQQTEEQAPVAQNAVTSNQSAQRRPSATSRMQLALPATDFELASTSTVYTDADDEFAITLPAGWLAIAEANGPIQENLTLLAKENAQVAALMEGQLSTMSDIPVSLIAFDLSFASLNTGFATNVNVMKQPVPAGIPLNFVVQLNSDQLKTILGLTDVAESSTRSLSAGEAVVLDYELNADAIARQYYLLHAQSLYIVTFTGSTSLGDSAGALFDEMMQSFQFVN